MGKKIKDIKDTLQIPEPVTNNQQVKSFEILVLESAVFKYYVTIDNIRLEKVSGQEIILNAQNLKVVSGVFDLLEDLIVYSEIRSNKDKFDKALKDLGGKC